MEERQEITAAANTQIGDLCTEMNDAIKTLIHALPKTTIRQNIDQLPLLTLGAQADITYNTRMAGRQRRVEPERAGVVEADDSDYLRNEHLSEKVQALCECC